MSSKKSQSIQSVSAESLKKPKRSKPFTLNEATLKEIEVLGGHGATLENLRIYYSISERQFYKIAHKDPRIVDAIFLGRTKTMFSVAGLLLEKAKAGNVTAMIFWLKTQGRWIDNHVIGLTDSTHDKIIPKKLGTDPVEASRIYQEIMK